MVGVESRRGRINQSQCSIPSIVIGWFFPFCFRLRQSSFHWIISGVGRKWERSHSSDSDSVELMTPLTTPSFDFHYVISALTTPSTTLTPSLVETSLKHGTFLSHGRTPEVNISLTLIVVSLRFLNYSSLTVRKNRFWKLYN